eukprot:jgi/Tetstr1/438983/TSEL_027475.t1
MARYVTWLGYLRTIKASSLQLYLSPINNFFKDHGREPMALSDEGSMVRKVLAASHVVTLHPELLGAPLPARVVLKALTLAKPYGWSWDLPGARTRVPWCSPAGAWTSHSLVRKGPTTPAYVIGVTM